ncbi:MAG: protein kinase, partial [archaeon]|nr:protein kinase [archaeon]
HRKSAKSPFQDDELLYYAHQVISGIAFLHDRGISHRDIKSANIVLDGNLKADRYYSSVKLCDFGVSVRQRQTPSLGQASSTKVGTEQYSAPEVLLRVPDANPACSDIWSFAMFLVELLTLDAPYNLEPRERRVGMIASRTLPSNLPHHPQLSPLIDKCTNLEPTKRPTSLEVTNQIERLLNREPRALAFLSARNRLSWQ